MSPIRGLQIKGLSDSTVALPQFLNEIPVGIIVFNPDRRVVLINRALEALTGFHSREAYGIPCRYILRSNLCMQGCQMKLVGETSEPVCAEANIINRNRQKISVRLTTGPILDSRGHLAGFIKSVEDLRSCEDIVDESGKSFLFGRMVGRSHEMQRIFRVIPVIAQTDSSVLITGQTGTGKDFVAEAIHHASNRAKGPFIKVNCGALPESLLESELFGHQKGAFTGAVENKPGRFRLAHNGTLYLTEIGDLPLNLQVKLLSFLDDKVLHPLGSTKGVHVDVRVIAATHRNLEQMVREGRFREDLLFRLNVVRLHLPPLVKRGDDIRMLMDHFLQTFSPRFKKKVTEVSDEARHALVNYPYPGNVRELRNIVEYAVNVCEGNRILLEHLPTYILEYRPGEHEPNGVLNGVPAVPSFKLLEVGPDMSWTDTERKMILDAMLKTQGRRSEAAKILGWGRSTLWRKLKRYGIMS
ncbi:MAG TPA: sigma 54-interacting transcriptional regulator [Desulfomonilaceae bacterium]|nr:sigma 54-interacting transcriptional regulator [Desulfomonilaceae bacterium]